MNNMRLVTTINAIGFVSIILLFFTNSLPSTATPSPNKLLIIGIIVYFFMGYSAYYIRTKVPHLKLELYIYRAMVITTFAYTAGWLIPEALEQKSTCLGYCLLWTINFALGLEILGAFKPSQFQQAKNS